MSFPHDTLQFLPREAREQFRKENLSKTPITCSQFCAGYLQANIACVPFDLADDFERLCITNSSPFPLLYRSKPGEVGAPPLASNSDVRTDLPIYAVSENGIHIGIKENLLEIPWDDMVTFYFGCSYSFDHFLVAAKVPLRHMIKKQDPSVYLCGIPLIPQGPFSGNMIVTMRAIPREFVQKVAEVCVPLDFAHGAPIHIGAPALIGIEEFHNPPIGNKPMYDEHDVFVFWGCGISGSEVMAAAKPRVAVSLSMRCSGSLFITDCLVTEFLQQHPSEQTSLSPKVIFLSESPQFASLVSQEAMDEIVNKENEFTSIKPKVSSNGLQEREDKLLKSALALSHASYVAIVTLPQEEAKQDSERQMSAVVCIVKALLAQDKEMTIITQKHVVTEWKTFLAKCESQNIVSKSVPVVPIAATTRNWSRDVCSVVAMVVDDLGSRFSSSSLNSMIFVNEQGMLTVQSLLSLGEDANNVTKVNGDHVVANGQPIESSCWLSPFLVAMGTYILQTCPIHSRYLRRGLGLHNVKPATEFFVTPSNTLVMERQEVEFVQRILNAKNSPKI